MGLRMKYLAMGLGFFMALGALAACGDETRSGGNGGEGGSSSSSSSSTTTSSGTAGGGTGGMGTGGMGSGGGSGSSSSGMMGSAYGQICNQALPCPMGQQCITTGAMAVAGICSIECQGQMDQATCSVFMGPGKGICNITLKDPNGGADKFYCNIACGEQYLLPNDCPMGLTCKDLVGPMGMADGKLDSCAP